MSFTENLYLRKQLQKLQEENLKLRQILEQASPRPLSERPRPTPGGNLFDDAFDDWVNNLYADKGPLRNPASVRNDQLLHNMGRDAAREIELRSGPRPPTPLPPDEVIRQEEMLKFFRDRSNAALQNRPPETLPQKITRKTNDAFRNTSNFMDDAIDALYDNSRRVVPKAGSTVSKLAKGGALAAATVAGDLAGEYIVKPAAEKAGVFDAVGTASKAAFERMSPAAVDAADKALGASQYVLSGGPVNDTVSAVADAISASNKKQAEKEVNRAKTGNLGPKPGPKF